MTDRSLRSRVAIAAWVALALVVAACGGQASPVPTSAATQAPAAAATPTPSAVAAGPFDGLPIACMGLGDADCRRALDHAAALVTEADPPAVYVQVGPFGCPTELPCAPTLAARPEGDVVIEFAGAPAIGFHLRAVPDGSLAATRQEAFGVVLDPTSSPPVVAAPQPLSLGHCGLWSGIDVGGSWWDPVGPIDISHPDAINAADGIFTPVDPDHATFLSAGGLSVQLQRRDGGKHLPFCD